MVKLNMKYPRLPEGLDLRKKLMAQDIAAIQQAYAEASPFPTKSELMKRRLAGIETQSKTQWIREMMEMYQVSFHTVYYWTHDEYRASKMLKNAKAHNKADISPEDYKAHGEHRKKSRLLAFQRFPLQKDFHALTSAKSEKRSKRYTYKGKPIEDWQ